MLDLKTGLIDVKDKRAKRTYSCGYDATSYINLGTLGQEGFADIQALSEPMDVAVMDKKFRVSGNLFTLDGTPPKEPAHRLFLLAEQAGSK